MKNSFAPALWLIAALVLVFTPRVWSQEPGDEPDPEEKPKTGMKIGFADIKKIIDEYKRTQTLEEKIDREREKKSDEIQKKKTKLDEIKDELKMLAKGSLVFFKKTKEGRRLEMEINLMEDELKIDLQRRLLWATKQIYEDISMKIEDFAREKGYMVIFKVEKGEIESESKAELILKINSRSVLYYDPSLDVSQEIIDRLNRDFVGAQPDEEEGQGDEEETQEEGGEGAGKTDTPGGEGDEDPGDGDSEEEAGASD